MNLYYRRFFGRLLIAFFLFGQTAAFAHQFSHDVTTSDHCVLCLTQSHLDNMVAVSGRDRLDPCHNEAISCITDRKFLPLYLSASLARAPPRIL